MTRSPPRQPEVSTGCLASGCLAEAPGAAGSPAPRPAVWDPTALARGLGAWSDPVFSSPRPPLCPPSCVALPHAPCVSLSGRRAPPSPAPPAAAASPRVAAPPGPGAPKRAHPAPPVATAAWRSPPPPPASPASPPTTPASSPRTPPTPSPPRPCLQTSPAR